MTEYKQDFKKREYEPRVTIKACMFFYKQIDKHLKNVAHLSKETLKYYVDRLLECTLILEDYSNQMYESLTDEEKEILHQLEEQRNYKKYRDSSGVELSASQKEAVDNLIESYDKRYESIRKEIIERVSNKET